MSFPVYDCRQDLRNILVTPQIRARFCRAEPGTGGHETYHTHDLGHEIFLVLTGRLEFRISGKTREVGAGQLCFALAGEPHSVRVLGDEPAHFYLSVTPHIQPTHTFYDDAGARRPPLFRPSSDYDARPDDPSVPMAELIGRHLEAVRATADAAQRCAEVQQMTATALEAALAAGNGEEAARLREQMWAPLLDTFARVGELAQAWNHLAPRAGGVHAFY